MKYLAAQTVLCPRCPAPPGGHCRSTGGGNAASAPTHAVRIARVENWDDALVAEACAAVRAWSVRRVIPVLVDFDRFEVAAKPIPAVAAAPAPDRVKLTGAQQEWIEITALGLRTFISTAHFSGDAVRRRTVQALEEKGILECAGYTAGGWDRIMILTSYGWDVYRRHPKIIRELDPAAIDAAQQRAVCGCHTYETATGDGEVDTDDCRIHGYDEHYPAPNSDLAGSETAF